MHVEVLWWRGCPSWEEAIDLVRQELAAVGLDPGTLALTEVSTEEEAGAADFVGSPTVRVEGRDVVDAGDDPPALTCRVYRLRDGRVSPLPDPADIRKALIDARGGDDGERNADDGRPTGP